MKNIPLLSENDIEIKVKQVREKGCVCLLYKTARVDMAILDDVFGAENWECDYKETKGNLYCGIGIYYPERQKTVWKWDCGIESRNDGEGNEKKGEASDAFKRASTKVGIGRELYTAPFIFLKVPTVKEGNNYKLADKYQTFAVKKIEYIDHTISLLIIVDDDGKEVYSYGTGKHNSEQIAPVQTEIKETLPTLEEAKTYEVEGADGNKKKLDTLTSEQLMYVRDNKTGRIKDFASLILMERARTGNIRND